MTVPERAPFGSRLLGPADEDASRLRVRVQSLTTTVIVGAHLVGVLAVVALVWWVLPRSETIEGSLLVADAIAIPVYVAIAVVIGVVRGTRQVLRRVAFIVDEREPTDAERRAALRVPISLVRLQAALWAGGVLTFTVLTFVFQPGLALTVALAVSLGGSVTCMAAYLLSELVMRPVAARALATDRPDQQVVPGVTTRLLLAWALGSAIPVLGTMIVAVLALARDEVSVHRLAAVALVLGGTSLLIGALLTWLAVRATVDPVRSLRHALQRVERGDLDTGVTVFDGTEIGLLQTAFNRMIEGLREREHIRDLFGRHVGEDVARDALAREVALGGENREVSVLFVDIIGSTEIAASRPPEEVVALLNRFFAVVVDVIDDCGGVINKFEGDGVLAVFGAPAPHDHHAAAALSSARTMCARLRSEISECEAGIGVSGGRVVAGNVGEQRRFEYTVIGDPVNEASRLCEQAKRFEERVVASMAVVEAAGEPEAACWRPGPDIELRGRGAVTRTALPLATEVQ